MFKYERLLRLESLILRKRCILWTTDVLPWRPQLWEGGNVILLKDLWEMYNCIFGKRIFGLLLWISFFPPNWISCIIYHNQARVARTRLVVLSRGEYSGSPATKVGVHFLNTKLSWSFSLFRFTSNNLHSHLLKHFLLAVPLYGMMTHWAMILRCCWPRWLVGDTSCESTATVLETPLLEISPTVGKGGIQFGIQH